MIRTPTLAAIVWRPCQHTPSRKRSPTRRVSTSPPGSSRSRRFGRAPVARRPYAAPPIGASLAAAGASNELARSAEAKRFGPPLPSGSDAIRCSQGSENCLYLNVYAPGTRAGHRRLPVMVWIHGGGFVNGSGNDFNGRFLAATARAIVVTSTIGSARSDGWL